MTGPLVEARGLRIGFGAERAVREVSFRIEPGECVAFVGESGSGKSVTARSLVGLAGPGADVRAERLVVGGTDVRRLPERRWRSIRGGVVGLVLQDALVSLDPLRPVGAEIAETLRRHRAAPRGRVRERTIELLATVGVPEPGLRARQRPHQLSGGLRQRALIASAIAADPALLIADEPTTALDVTVQAQILDLLAERKRAGTALLLISHDLAVVARLADRVHVMKDGAFVEEGPVREVLRAPRHPYTRTLLAAIPSERTRGSRLTVTAEPGPAAASAPGPAPGREAARKVVVEADGLVKAFGDRRAVDEVSFRLHAGETLGIVGESGSGKTTVARLVLGLVPPDGGEVRLDGAPWSALSESGRRPRRREIQLVHQDPLSSFDPRLTVRRLLDEALRDGGPSRATLLDQVGLSPALLDRRPRELSGGQRQRLAIARALAPSPRVLVCDEPVSALDVSVQAQVLDLLADLQARLGVAYLFVSHHLGVVHHLSDRVLVMRGGRVVEAGPVGRVLTRPATAYTRELVAAIPRLDGADAGEPVA
ncbi:ABC transporter ATP-binding protein [Spirillospora sp. NBC_01491]|uniref:ABC transporter ATP-binding protein n=1 Tax=Spirillospora sp. NBC_01491 TaxID=2976007 RepID=UPI002E31DD2F|nr:ABC transporter ATP-binding protein [Spirillospora sp. NBC_01491]